MATETNKSGKTSSSRWASYAKAAGVGALTMGAAGSADGAIIEGGGTHNGSAAAFDIVIDPPTLAYQNSFDIDGDGTTDFLLGSGNYGSVFGFDTGYSGTIFTNGAATSYAESFQAGDVIDGSSTPSGIFFGVNVLNPSTTFGAGQSGKVGFQTSQGYFGWMDISLELTPLRTDFTDNGIQDLKLTVHNWTYDDSGAPITVTPEPNSLALLAVGSVGLLARRRRKNAS